MIRKFQKYSTGLVAKLMMLLLAASFVMWGIGDVFNGMGSTNYVAKIGTQTIGVTEFKQQMDLRLANYRQLLGAEYSPEIIKRLGLPQQILTEMVNGLLLQNEAQSLGITLSDTEIMKMVSNNEAFRDSDGFDKNMFNAVLKRSGMTEDVYLKALRADTSSNLLLAHLDGSALIQRPMLEALYRLRAETREATLYVFSPKSLGAPSQPGEQELSDYFKKNRDQFKTSELRKLSYVTINPKELRKEITVKESTLRKLYESRKDSYRSPEQRKVRQLLYSKKEQAMSALRLLQQNVSFEDVAKKVQPENKELGLGIITASELVAEAREPVFALQKGAYSGAIETAFGWHIFIVDKMIASKIPDFEKVEAQLREEVAESKLEDRLYKLSVDLEDQLAGGISLADAAKEMNLKLTESAFFDQQGMTREETAAELPPVQNILARAFSGDLENTPEFQSGSDGLYYFLTLQETSPAAIPSLQKIRQKVVAQWQRETTASKLSKKVTQVVELLQKGKQDVLKGLIYETKKTGKITRSGSEEEGADAPVLSRSLQEEIFMLKSGEYSHASMQERGEWVIARLDAVHPLKAKTISDDDLAGLHNEMSEQYSDELMQLYLSHLRRKFPIQVNQAALESLLK